MNSAILQQCTKEKPNFKLKACLEQYDASRLVELANKQHLLVNMGEPINLKTLDIKDLKESLYNQICSHFEKDLFYLPPREIDFISKLMCSDFRANDNIDYEDCKFLHSLGYVHLYHWNGKLYPVIPRELRRIYKGIPKDELDSEIKLNNRLYSYAIALTQIHGFYKVEHFVEVWNTHNKDKIKVEDATWYLDMMYDRQDYFSFDYFYVVTLYPSNEYGYKLVRDNPNKSHRIPTFQEIEFYSKERISKDYLII